jgi:hypothetical protein
VTVAAVAQSVRMALRVRHREKGFTSMNRHHGTVSKSEIVLFLLILLAVVSFAVFVWSGLETGYE